MDENKKIFQCHFQCHYSAAAYAAYIASDKSTRLTVFTGIVSGMKICLTSHPNSPLTNISDISLVAVSIEAQNYREAATSRLSQLLIGDCLIEFLANQTREGAILNMDRMEEVYEQHRESIS